MWCTAFLAGGGVLLGRLFVWPHAPAVDHADAVFVLAGDYGDRLAKGLELIRDGVAPTLVLDGQPDFAAAAELCHAEQPFEVVCLRPHPDSTLGEARAAAELVTARRWQTVIVVTSRSHVSRARLLFRRCVPAAILMVATEPPYGLRAELGATSHEILGFANAVLRPKAC